MALVMLLMRSFVCVALGHMSGILLKIVAALLLYVKGMFKSARNRSATFATNCGEARTQSSPSMDSQTYSSMSDGDWSLSPIPRAPNKAKIA